MSLNDVFGKPTEHVETERAKLDYAFALEKVRRVRGLSYKEAAARDGESAGYISRVFRGDENVTIATMVKLATVLEGTLVLHVYDKRAQESATAKRGIGFARIIGAQSAIGNVKVRFSPAPPLPKTLVYYHPQAHKQEPAYFRGSAVVTQDLSTYFETGEARKRRTSKPRRSHEEGHHAG